MSLPSLPRHIFIALSAAFLIAMPFRAFAQDDAVFEQAAVESDAEQPQGEDAEKAKREAMERHMKERGGRPGKGGPPNGEDGKPDPAKDGKPGQEGENKNESAEKTVKRPTEPEKPFDPRQYEAVKPNPEGEYKLAFVGTPWPPLIQWLGEISGRSVDWRELPGDFLNLQTQRAYSVDQVGDIINRHLLARGYTILIDGELLTVEKTADINSSLVPRVAAESLVSHLPYEFARVLFDLDWLVAEEVAKELKPLVSTNGKLTSFAGTNRIEVMDSVRNLQQISEILGQEQSVMARSKLVREFELKYVPAASVRKKLEELLGVKAASANQPMTPEQMQQQQQEMMRRAQRGQQPPQQQPQQPSGDSKISFVVNDQRNSLIATAPPDKMAVIVETIAILDVPTGRGDSLDSYLGRMKAYRLVSLNPSEVVAILTETGGLDPTTKLKVDDKSKSIIANAPPWDHMTIQKLIDKLDGSSREFRVLRLRRRRADQVATTIQGLMVGEEKKDDSRNRRYGWWGPSEEEEKSDDKFRVAADIEHNWLLLWCNDIEYEQVLKLLQELGEVPDQGVSPSTYRVLQEVPDGEASEFLKRVKEAFEQMAPNSVQIDPAVEESLKEAERKRAEEQKAKEEERESKELEQKERALPKTQDVRFDVVTKFVQSTSSSLSTPTGAATNSAPPIRITQDSNGRIIIKSDDPRALDLFEEISAQLMPRPKGFQVFHLQHNTATWVVYKLESFFEEDDDKKDNNRPWWYYDEFPDDSSDKKAGLGDQPKIKFVSEVDSNTIVVRNATDSQLKTIEELLKIYDIPEPKDPDKARYTTIYSVKHSRASLISETIKSAFPDLLSSNDSVVQRGRQQPEGRGNGRNNNGRNNGGNRNNGNDEEERPPSGGGSNLLGKLSIGADDTTNTLIVSTEGEQLTKVMMPIIEQLDKAAENADIVKVYALPGGSSSAIAQSLSALLGDGSIGKQNGERPNQDGQGGEDQEGREREEQMRRDFERNQRGQNGGRR